MRQTEAVPKYLLSIFPLQFGDYIVSILNKSIILIFFVNYYHFLLIFHVYISMEQNNKQNNYFSLIPSNKETKSEKQDKKEVVKNKPKIRELTLVNGLSYPTDAELIMLIIGKGTSKTPVEKLSEKILNVINSSEKEDLLDNLSKLEGIGESKALMIAAAMELGYRRFKHLEAVVKKPQDLLPYVQHYTMDKREHFIAVTLNGSSELLNIRVIAVGTQNKTVFQAREVFYDAIKNHASGIICCHNHPFGPCFPSKADIQTTEILVKAAELLGINFFDHIIITKDSYFSFLEHGMLSKI